jgi:hypothetical protein
MSLARTRNEGEERNGKERSQKETTMPRAQLKRKTYDAELAVMRKAFTQPRY